MSDNEKNLFWICVILTMAMAFTAMMIALPRICDIHSNLNFDYQTMIVTILGIFITALIGWQIWATISSREEISEMRRNAENAERRFDELNANLTTQRETITHLVEATRLYSIAHSIRTIAELDAINQREAYALYLEAIVEFLQSNPKDFVDRCLAGMSRCQNSKTGAFDYTPKHNTDFVERCNRNYAILEGMFNRLTPQQRDEIRRLRDVRLKYHTAPAE